MFVFSIGRIIYKSILITIPTLFFSSILVSSAQESNSCSSSMFGFLESSDDGIFSVSYDAIFPELLSVYTQTIEEGYTLTSKYDILTDHQRKLKREQLEKNTEFEAARARIEERIGSNSRIEDLILARQEQGRRISQVPTSDGNLAVLQSPGTYTLYDVSSGEVISESKFIPEPDLYPSEARKIVIAPKLYANSNHIMGDLIALPVRDGEFGFRFLNVLTGDTWFKSHHVSRLSFWHVDKQGEFQFRIIPAPVASGRLFQSRQNGDWETIVDYATDDWLPIIPDQAIADREELYVWVIQNVGTSGRALFKLYIDGSFVEKAVHLGDLVSVDFSHDRNKIAFLRILSETNELLITSDLEEIKNSIKNGNKYFIKDMSILDWNTSGRKFIFESAPEGHKENIIGVFDLDTAAVSILCESS